MTLVSLFTSEKTRREDEVSHQSVSLLHITSAFTYSQVDDEDQGVVIFDLLHGRLGGERITDDAVFVLLDGWRDCLSGIL